MATVALTSPLGAVVVPSTTIVIFRNDAAVDGNGLYAGSGGRRPVVNNSGLVAFQANLYNTAGGSDDNSAIYLADGTTIAQLARKGDAAPGGNGVFSSFTDMQINNADQVLFKSNLDGTSGGSGDNQVIYLATSGSVTQMMRNGQAAPDNHGMFSSLGAFTFNDVGRVAFDGLLTGTLGGTSNDRGIFRTNGTQVNTIAREGMASPDSNGTFATLEDFSMNRSGRVAFYATLAGTAGGASDDSGLFRGQVGSRVVIAREGQAAPDANGVFGHIGPAGFEAPAFNNAGQVIFTADLTGTAGGSADDEGVFLGDGTTLTQIARKGGVAPDGVGEYYSLAETAINNNGQYLFEASILDSPGGSTGRISLVLGDGGTLTEIVSTGQTAPDGNGTLHNFDNVALNKWGQVVFTARIDGTSITNDMGLFFYDEQHGLFQVARKGDPQFAGTINSIEIHGNASYRGDLFDSLGRGQVAYSFSVLNPNLSMPTGIGLWTLPEPASAALLAIGLAACVRRNRPSRSAA